MHWTNKYIGIPYKKFDCAQLVQFALKQEFDVDFELPQLVPKNIQLRSSMIKNEANKRTMLDRPFEGCVVLMNCHGGLNHIGVYTEIDGRPFVLHSMAIAKQVVCHSFKKLSEMSIDIQGFYSWQK